MGPILIKPEDKLSEHFTIGEALESRTADIKGINNSPDIAALIVMISTAKMMERVRDLLNNPITINSWYRNPVLNKAVGGVPTSQHAKGEAVDFICPKFGSPINICKEIIKNKNIIQFDQLIHEHTWVHISFAIQSGKPRGQVLSLLNGNKYSQGLTDKLGNSL